MQIILSISHLEVSSPKSKSKGDTKGLLDIWKIISTMLWCLEYLSYRNAFLLSASRFMRGE